MVSFSVMSSGPSKCGMCGDSLDAVRQNNSPLYVNAALLSIQVHLFEPWTLAHCGRKLKWPKHSCWVNCLRSCCPVSNPTALFISSPAPHRAPVRPHPHACGGQRTTGKVDPSSTWISGFVLKVIKLGAVIRAAKPSHWSYVFSANEL